MKNPPLDHAAVIDRMKAALGVETDGQLARCLGITRGAISHWRKGQKTPMDRVVDVGNRASANLSWLLHGRGEMRAPPYRPGTSDPYFDGGEALDWDVMEIVIRQIQRRVLLQGVQKETSPDVPKFSSLFISIKLLYARYFRAMQALLEEGLTREHAIKALELGAELSHERSRPTSEPQE